MERDVFICEEPVNQVVKCLCVVVVDVSSYMTGELIEKLNCELLDLCISSTSYSRF